MTIKTYLILFLSTLLSVHSFAGTTFCFSKITSLNAVKKHLEVILLPNEKTKIDLPSHCLYVDTQNHRVDFLNKWIKSKFPLKNGNTISRLKNLKEVGGSKSCQIKIVKRSSEKDQKSKLKANKNLSFKTLSHKGASESVKQMMLQMGRVSSIRFENFSTMVSCTRSGPDSFLIDLKLKDDHSDVSTSLTVFSGKELNITNTLIELRNRSHSLSTDTGIKIKDKYKNIENQYFITVY